MNNPQHTDLTPQILRLQNTPTYTPPKPHCSSKRKSNHMVNRYIVLWRIEQSSSEYTRSEMSRIHVTSHYTKYTSDLDLLRHSIFIVYIYTMHLSKMDQHAAYKTTHQTNKKFIMKTAGHRLAISNNVKSRNVTASSNVLTT